MFEYDAYLERFWRLVAGQKGAGAGQLEAGELLGSIARGEGHERGPCKSSG
jgi:hypothetical protein